MVLFSKHFPHGSKLSLLGQLLALLEQPIQLAKLDFFLDSPTEAVVLVRTVQLMAEVEVLLFYGA